MLWSCPSSAVIVVGPPSVLVVGPVLVVGLECSKKRTLLLKLVKTKQNEMTRAHDGMAPYCSTLNYE